MIKNNEIISPFGDQGSASYVGSEIDRDSLARSLQERLRGISLEKFVSYITNEFAEQIEYARLCAGYKACQKTSLLFNPHRLSTKTRNSELSVFEATQTESFCSGLARVIKWQDGEDKISTFIQYGINGVQYVNEFPPAVARQMAINYGLSADSKILDPCAGWGGRMIGFSTICNNYAACEPSTKTYFGLYALFEFIASFRPDFKAKIIHLPFEDINVTENSYDFAMTSPPYYDTEEYSDEESNSLNRYKSFDDWVYGFYEPLITKTLKALKPGCCLVLNIGSRVYPLSDTLKGILHGTDYKITKLKSYLSGQGGLNKSGEGESFYEIKKPE